MILYVYAIGRAGHPLPDDVEAVDGGGLTAFFAPVDEVEFSQPVIDARSKRVESLAALEAEIADAAPGRAFLLGKKLDEERKRASREAEQQVAAEIEQAVLEKLACEAVAESRERRDGAFPQINVLIPRDEEAGLQELRDALAHRYDEEGVTLALTGPWPPYTFAR